MAYRRLTEVLTKLGETDLEVHSAFLLKLGCVRLLTFEVPPLSSRFPMAELDELSPPEREQESQVGDLLAGIMRALEKHPNVFDIAVLDRKRTIIAIPYRIGTLFRGEIFSLQVDLPARLQKYRTFGKPIEQFEVVCSGSIFAAFATIEDYPVLTHIGHEYRELLRTQVEKETSFKCPPIGPSPIHPGFYFVFRKKRNEAPPVGMKIYALKDDVLIVFDENSQTDRDVAMTFLSEIDSPLLDFYSAQLTREVLIYFYEEIFNHFSDLSNSTKGLLATPWWRIFKSSKLAHIGRKSLSNIHTRFVDFEAELFSFDRERNRLLDQIKQHRILSGIRGYFYEQTAPDIQIPQALFSALNHFEGELQTFGKIRSVVIASLAGAAVGAALTAILTQLF